MLNQLCRLAIPIIQRKKEKWNTSIVSEAYPLMELHESYTEKLYARLDLLETGQLELKCVLFQYKGLADLKLKLDHEPWHRPNGLDQTQMTCFAHDLLFYLMINSLLDLATYLFGAYIPDEEQLSFSARFHRLKLNSQKVMRTYQHYLPAAPLLNQLLKREEPPYFIMWSQLNKSMKHKILPHPLQELLQDQLDHLDVIPVSAYDEATQLTQMEVLNHHLKSFIQNQRWSTLRELIQHCLSACPARRFTLDNFLLLQKTYTIGQRLDEEAYYWKEALKALRKGYSDSPPAYRLYLQIIKACKSQQPEKKEACRQLCHYTIDWVGHPFTLLRYLHPILTRGQLLIDGSPDLSRLSAFLSSLLRIKKVRSEGCLTSSTLLTYIKKMNSGDME